jgi:hypothetical protein
MKASDIDDREILRAIEETCIERGVWSSTSVVAERFPDFPPKVVAAKLAKLLGRGLVTGCDCGCRGDWELTAAGRALAGIEEAWRENPIEGMRDDRLRRQLSESEQR